MVNFTMHRLFCLFPTNDYQAISVGLNTILDSNPF